MEHAYGEQVTQSDGESDGKRRRTVEVRATTVAAGKDGQNQNHGYHKLDPERLFPRQARVDGGQTEVSADRLRGQALQHRRPGHRSRALGGDVEQGPGDADATAGEHRHRHRRVDVTAALVGETPDDGRHRQAEGERDLNRGRRLERLPVLIADARPAADQDEDHRSQGLGQQPPPEIRAL